MKLKESRKKQLGNILPIYEDTGTNVISYRQLFFFSAGVMINHLKNTLKISRFRNNPCYRIAGRVQVIGVTNSFVLIYLRGSQHRVTFLTRFSVLRVSRDSISRRTPKPSVPTYYYRLYLYSQSLSQSTWTRTATVKQCH
jgi:hypothetical protein